MAISKSHLLVPFLLFSVACSSTTPKPEQPLSESGESRAAPHTAPASAPSTDVQHEPGVYDLRTGEKIERDLFYDRLATATYVLVGESHPDIADHTVQDQVYRALLERHERPVALGMEMVSRPYQAPLEDYARGRIDEEEMLDQLQWKTRWGFPHLLYAPLWRAARADGSPLVALNARRELTKAVSSAGVDGLDPAMAADLPELDLTNDAHRDWMRDIFESHGMAMEESKFERFYQAQVVWDETMAQTAYEFVTTNDVAAMMIVAGRGHTERGWGISSRIQRRIGDAGATVVTVSPMRTKAPPLSELQKIQLSDYVVFYD